MAGEVMPVFRRMAKSINNLFAVNERVILEGSWLFGRFFYAAISAYNVGDIRLSFEPGFHTNLPKRKRGPENGECHLLEYLVEDDESPYHCHRVSDDPRFEGCNHMASYRHRENSAAACRARMNNGVCLERGDEIGEFKLGSTVVMLFEGPANLKLAPRVLDHHVRMGQLLATWNEPSCALVG
eukprot:Protomagalhaensia_sp_Gyna_25__639@NODE_12_length_8628_cov_38_763069_g8_i0_p6_GENE_NODE_12_length_8628_cov_38_763069_g8_i0NODE_12_length_8628_cov_38_763069_g8_i0_p6_ORF_typecomplete_len183_score21_51PS_Dcarbxylase/PF02666_15/3_1e21DUF2633/PF11119_8/0_51_NODE_12_length_8628_cov_38_763069_g8_i031493697